jgi:hypothetical protein
MAEWEESCAKLINVDVKDIWCDDWGLVRKMPDPGDRMCSSFSGDARTATILWICCSFAAALANGWKRKTNSMSAFLNHGFGGCFNHRPFRDEKKGVIY